MKALKVWGIIVAVFAGLGLFGCFMEFVNGGRSLSQAAPGGAIFLAAGIVAGGIVAAIMTIVKSTRKNR